MHKTSPNSSLDPKISQVYPHQEPSQVTGPHSAARLLQANHALTDFPFQVCFLHVWPGARNRETNYAALQQQTHKKITYTYVHVYRYNIYIYIHTYIYIHIIMCMYVYIYNDIMYVLYIIIDKKNCVPIFQTFSN